MICRQYKAHRRAYVRRIVDCRLTTKDGLLRLILECQYSTSLLEGAEHYHDALGRRKTYSLGIRTFFLRC